MDEWKDRWRDGIAMTIVLFRDMMGDGRDSSSESISTAGGERDERGICMSC